VSNRLLSTARVELKDRMMEMAQLTVACHHELIIIIICRFGKQALATHSFLE
jgi:hypothetical protein